MVHLLRNSFRYAARQDWDKAAKALKPVCTAPSEDAATERFLEFQEPWGTKYPAIVQLWSDAWAEFVPFLSFDVEIRKVICSTTGGPQAVDHALEGTPERLPDRLRGPPDPEQPLTPQHPGSAVS